MLDSATTSLNLPLQQSPEYARACEAMGLKLRACKREQAGEVQLWWQVQSRHVKPFGRVDLISRGPVGQSTQDVRDWLLNWRRWHDERPLLLNAVEMQPDWLRNAGFWPLMTPASLAILPLAEQAQMRAAQHQKWRNRLKKAEGERMKVTRHALTPEHWILHKELTQARDMKYRPLPPALSASYTRVNPGQAVVFEARHKGDLIAAALFLRHGRMATWQMGHSTSEGRKMNAMNLILWRAMCWLQEQGHSQLDLGVINDQDSPGLTRFKLGSGAQRCQLSGTWLHSSWLAPFARRLPLRLAA